MDENSIDILKRKLQNYFNDKTVLIVGSGLSCGEGIPGMAALSDYLCRQIPALLSTKEDSILWDSISKELKSGVDLESTLLSNPVSQTLEDIIINITSELMLKHEQIVLEKCIINSHQLKIKQLLPYLSVDTPKDIHIITTNYDRLIEFAAESLGFGINTMMIGKYWGNHNPVESLYSLCKGVAEQNRKVRIIYKNKVTIYKPHGSLDWYSTPQGVISSTLNFNCQRMIITPGTQKYLKGYTSPFDTHRDKGNQAIDRASSIIFVGYGFNDSHLQTHIADKLTHGTKGIIITRSLSENAKNIIKNSPNLIALSKSELNGLAGTLVTIKGSADFIPNVEWWDVEKFVEGVLSA